jgi:hypothetical protein
LRLFSGSTLTPGGEKTMADSEREPQNNSLEEVAAAASDRLQAQQVSVNASAARHIEAGQVKMNASSVGRIKAHAVRMENSAAALANTGSLEAQESAVGATIAREVTLKKSMSPLIIAKKVKLTESRVLLLVAGKVQGNVRAVFTIWSALAAGFGVGAALITLGKFFARRPLVSKGTGARVLMGRKSK